MVLGFNAARRSLSTLVANVQQHCCDSWLLMLDRLNVQSLPPYTQGDDLARFLRVSHNRLTRFEPVNAIFPRHVAPVVRYAQDGEREIVLMTWGFMRLEKGRAPKPVTNVRDDQIRRTRSGATLSVSDGASCRHRRSANPMAT